MVTSSNFVRTAHIHHAWIWCNISASFSRATSPSLIVWLYLTYTKLPKLTAVSNAGVYEKLAILEEYLLDHKNFTLSQTVHVWSPFGRSIIVRRTWADDRIGAINNIHRWMIHQQNGTATHEWTVVYDAGHRSYVEYKLSKNILTPYLETIIPNPGTLNFCGDFWSRPIVTLEVLLLLNGSK